MENDARQIASDSVRWDPGGPSKQFIHEGPTVR